MTSSSASNTANWPWVLAEIFGEVGRSWNTVSETAVASLEVVAARLPMINKAVSIPWSANVPELSRMAVEKLAAFTQSGNSYWDASQPIMRLLSQHSADWRSFVQRGPGVDIDVVYRVIDRSLAIGLLVARANNHALKPFHDRTIANARRLGR